MSEGCFAQGSTVSATNLADSMSTQRRRHHSVQNAVGIVVIADVFVAAAVFIIIRFVFALVLSLAFEPGAFKILWIQAERVVVIAVAAAVVVVVIVVVLSAVIAVAVETV